ncbi:alpha/beta hydrolase [Chitinibacter sp. SCUT-21]|uniref:alpha/beta fold hydrolase n=1 Tax=Chitinibacter sp. SCUT-21 TaxID=2970891 RepID=UPI0035A63C30
MSTWVLLRGLMREKRHWGDFATLLQAQCPCDEIVSIEWPGNGRLHQQPSFSRIEIMAEYIQQSLDNMGHTGQYHVVAISLGAMAAIEWAYSYPHNIASCTLINTSLRNYNPYSQRLRYQNWPNIVKLLFMPAIAREQIILQLTSQNPPTNTLAQWQHYAQQYPITACNAARQLLAATRYQAKNAAPPVPLLLLNGQQDRLVSPECSVAIARAWQVPLRTHPEAGHDLSLDAPDWVIAQIKDVFFKKTEPI